MTKLKELSYLIFHCYNCSSSVAVLSEDSKVEVWCRKCHNKMVYNPILDNSIKKDSKYRVRDSNSKLKGCRK